jgi:hypothetical protein
VTLDQQFYVMDDERNEQHGDQATQYGHIGASQRTIDLGATYLDRHHARKKLLKELRKKLLKTLCYT